MDNMSLGVLGGEGENSEEAGVNLLGSKNGEGVILPGSNTNMEDSEHLKSVSIKEAISGSEVDTRVFLKSHGLKKSNVLIDFGEQHVLTVFQREAIKSLLVQTDITEEQAEEAGIKLKTIYVMLGNNIMELGKGEEESLFKALPILLKSVLGDKVRIYVDVEPGAGKKLRRVTPEDRGSVRLMI